MNKKTLILIMLISIFNINLSYSYINISSCGTIDGAFLGGNDEVRLNQKLSTGIGNCINITVSNFILDCKAFLINSSNNLNTQLGISIDGYNNITIQNCNIQNFGNSLNEAGLRTVNNQKIILKNSNFSYNYEGIALYSTDSNIYNINSNNNIADGFRVGNDRINISNSIFSYNGANGFHRQSGNSAYLKVKDLITNNNGDNGFSISSATYNSTFNNIISNHNSDNGIELSYSYSNNFDNLSLTNNTDGLKISWLSNDNLISNYYIKFNNDDGISLIRNIHNNTFINGDLRNNTGDNIYFETIVNSPYNNTFTKTYIGKGSDIDSTFNFTAPTYTNFLEGNYWDDFNSSIHPPYCYTGGGWSFCDTTASLKAIVNVQGEEKSLFPLYNIFSIFIIIFITAYFLN